MPSQAEIEAAATALFEQRFSGYEMDALNKQAYGKWAEVVLTTAEKVREEQERKQQSLDDARINKALYGEARTQKALDEAARAEKIREDEAIRKYRESRTQADEVDGKTYYDREAAEKAHGQPIPGGKSDIPDEAVEAAVKGWNPVVSLRDNLLAAAPIIRQQERERMEQKQMADQIRDSGEVIERETRYYQSGYRAALAEAKARVELRRVAESVSFGNDLWNRAIDDALTAIGETDDE
jgi:hypothetical protein